MATLFQFSYRPPSFPPFPESRRSGNQGFSLFAVKDYATHEDLGVETPRAPLHTCLVLAYNVSGTKRPVQPQFGRRFQPDPKLSDLLQSGDNNEI